MSIIRNIKVTEFNVPGPAFAWPGEDEKNIYVGAGFDINCKSNSLIMSFNKENLDIVWSREVSGSVGDTTIVKHNSLLIFGAGNGVTALSSGGGEEIWRLDLPYDCCLQECMGVLEREVFFIGVAGRELKGVLSIDPNTGNLNWIAKTAGDVFGQVCVINDVLVAVDMAGIAYGIDRVSGERLWARALTGGAGENCPSFAGPTKIGEYLWVPSKRPWVFILSSDGKIVRRHSARGPFTAMARLIGNYVVTVQEDSLIFWYDPATLDAVDMLRARGPRTFATPLEWSGAALIASYGGHGADEKSVIELFHRRKKLWSFEVPTNGHALPTGIVDNGAFYGVLTPYSGGKVAALMKTSLAEIS